MRVPVLPIRELRFRLDKKSGTFVPCKANDSRGTLIDRVDATGRGVMAVTPNAIGDNRILGWKYPPGVDSPNSLMCDPAIVVAWMQKNPQLEATKSD